MKTVFASGFTCFMFVLVLQVFWTQFVSKDFGLLFLFSTALFAGIIVGGIMYLDLRIQQLLKSDKEEN